MCSALNWTEWTIHLLNTKNDNKQQVVFTDYRLINDVSWVVYTMHLINQKELQCTFMSTIHLMNQKEILCYHSFIYNVPHEMERLQYNINCVHNALYESEGYVKCTLLNNVIYNEF